ncbi:MAG TPA: protein-disulfide reductase DsbD domain-containing protein [Rhizomicrobium sp.]|nr:protein-disulfide reductase DsbD domain-containing protein [Rhizomicrobium sp.]
MKRFLFGVVALLAFATAASAQINSGPRVHAQLIAKTGEIAPGGTVTVALEEAIAPGWHTYWKNPGEAGLPSEIKWTLPPGWKVSEIAWPYPKRLPVGPLMNYGYEGKVWLFQTLTAPRDAKPGDVVTLNAAADWLVCKEVCIPEDTTLSLPLTVNASPTAPYATVKEQFDAARAKIPTPSPWPVSFAAGAKIDLFIASPSLAKSELKDAAFFPSDQGLITGMAEQQRASTNDGLVLRLTPEKNAKGPQALNGVLVLTSADGSVQALDLSAKPGAVPSADFGMTSGSGLGIVLLFALLGGLILNLMPCVLPILAMKALAVANHAHGDRSAAAREGFSYGAGAILSFAALGGLLVGLRAGGAAIGWGFQLQEPVAVAFFALLVFAVGLNLSGVFEVGNVTTGDALTRKSGWLGSFFTGVLAVAVAAPCTAPFMAAALGYALTQSATMAMLVFIVLGIGFAMPFVLIGISPAILRVLPKPGAWMLMFKQLLAFPMYGAAAWLLWVLSQETSGIGLIATLTGAVTLAFAAWTWNASRIASGRWRTAGALFALLGIVAVIASLVFVRATTIPPAAAAAHAEIAGIPCEPYTATKLASLRAQKRPVFVDATAAWCITCLVNEKVALSGAHVRDTFAVKHIAYLVADWTNRSAEITALLAAHGRSGVPLYLYYAPGAANAVVLPQVLTEGEVLQAIGS